MENTAIIPMQNEETGLKKWAPMVILSFALLIIILDTTILNVSLKTIIGDLGTTLQSIQWVITAYSLVLAAFTITGGRLGDLFGRKKIFMLGAIIFAIGSFITSISNSVGVMIMGEAIIEGIGAAMMMPATSSLIVSNYKGRDRQIAFGLWGGIAAAGAALGPILGGWLTTYYSWRWAFRLNIFVVIILLAFSFILKEVRDTEEKPEIDMFGVVLSSLGLLLLVFGFIESSTYGWIHAKSIFSIGSISFAFLGSISIVIFSIIAGLIILFLFVLWENKREREGHTPLVSMKLFKNTQFTFGATIMALLALSQTGMSFTIPVFFQAVKNLDAFHTAIAMLPMPLAILVVAPLSAYLSKHINPKRIIQAGLVLVAVGFVALIYGINKDGSAWNLLPGFILAGAGMGCMFSQTTNMTLSAVSVQQSGEASGVNGTMRTVGAALGSAILGAILLSSVSSSLIEGIVKSSVIPDQAKLGIVSAMGNQAGNIEFGNDQANANVPAEIGTEIKSLSADATVTGSRASLGWSILFIFIGFLLSFKLPNRKNVEVEHKPLASVH